jgi:hypothetical protein
MNQHYQKFSKSLTFLGAICGGILIGLPAIPQVALAQRQTSSKVNPCPSIFYEQPHDNRVLVPEGCPPNAFTRQAQQAGTVPTSEQMRQGVGGEAPNSRTGSSSQSYNYSSQRQSTTTRSGQDISSSSSETQTSIRQGTPGDYTVRTESRTQTYPSGQQTQSIITPLPGQQQAPSTRIALRDGKVNVRLVNETAAPISYQAVGDTAPRVLQGKSEVLLQGLSAPTTVTFQRQDNGLLMVKTQPSSQSGILEVRLDETTELQMDRKAINIQQDGQVFFN